MSRVVKKTPSVCTDMPLNNAEVCAKLHLMKELLRSCYGPTGRLKHIRNNIGGRVTTSSSSSVLLPALSSSQPLLNLIKSSILNHISRFSDCGLFAAIFCLSLLEHVRQHELRENLAIKVNKHCLSLCTSYLQREDCACRVKVNFCSSQNLMTLAGSIISSKPACLLTEAEKHHISTMVVRAFLQTIPCSTPGPVTLGHTVTVTIVGLRVLDSAVFPGLLVEMYDPFDQTDSSSGPLRTVLFSTSLAGDLAELGDGTIEVDPDVDTDLQVLNQLLELGKQLVEDEVRLCVCQKVIHPVLQQYLRSHGVVVLERLGMALMEPLSMLAGTQPVATLHARILSTAYGRVKNLSTKQFGFKTMLHLQPEGEAAVCTMVLCHRNETMLDELKVVCQKAEHGLRLTLKEPSALLGGGCTETHLSAYVKHKGQQEASESAAGLGCSPAEFLLGVKVFCRSLDMVARSLEHDGGTSVIDLNHAHHWTVSAGATKEDMVGGLGLCGCGLVENSPSTKWTFLNTEYAEFCPAPLLGDSCRKPTVLDSFTAKVNALQVAVETANLVLDVRYIIEDVN
ncbi:McKusick-Kaufman/Bardet-Biedl syndromes putative chaperonin isoform X2 [Oryzias melastigma]|uniref:MKKS centrosomal shuttling protein n=1 Tax=Oryzias melastigma TaxID=30732 RepID=A0A3B3DV88_ORYME|nr:McKusick-Kaufman/Bardet-Biedl syndromes putative chaperonin isoform X2 [Oryzias melastigma]